MTMPNPHAPLVPAAGIGRRTLLKGAVVAAAVPAAVLGTASPSHAALTYYSTIGTGSDVVNTRLRELSGGNYVHVKNKSFQYDPGFHTICNSWANTYGSILRYVTSGTVKTSWFGCIGVYTAKPGNHGAGNAFDLTFAQHSNGVSVDANYSHKSTSGLTHNRRYAGLAWATRKHCPEVGIVGSDPTHTNHIHAGRYKNGSSSLLLSHFGTSWDAFLVQYACNAFMSRGLVYDGDWGNQTEAGYVELMRRLGLPASGSSSPFSSTTGLQNLAHTLCARGITASAI